MILKFNKQGEFLSWMRELPKLATIDQDGKKVRTHDIRRAIGGEYKTAGGYQWREVSAENLEK